MAYTFSTFSNVSFIYNSNGTPFSNSTALPVYVNNAITISGNIAGITSNVYIQPTSTANLAINNLPATQNVQVLSNTTNYVYTQFAPTWSLDALNKVRTSATLNQDWFVPVVDDDTSFRWSQATSGTG